MLHTWCSGLYKKVLNINVSINQTLWLWNLSLLLHVLLFMYVKFSCWFSYLFRAFFVSVKVSARDPLLCTKFSLRFPYHSITLHGRKLTRLLVEAPEIRLALVVGGVYGFLWEASVLRGWSLLLTQSKVFLIQAVLVRAAVPSQRTKFCFFPLLLQFLCHIFIRWLQWPWRKPRRFCSKKTSPLN